MKTIMSFTVKAFASAQPTEQKLYSFQKPDIFFSVVYMIHSFEIISDWKQKG